MSSYEEYKQKEKEILDEISIMEDTIFSLKRTIEITNDHAVRIELDDAINGTEISLELCEQELIAVRDWGQHLCSECGEECRRSCEAYN